MTSVRSALVVGGDTAGTTSAICLRRRGIGVENSVRLGEWEKEPDKPDADPVGLSAQSRPGLAPPIRA